MKKFMSLVLALVMVCSLSVTAFAADTILTAEIPNSSGPSYTVEIPADTVLAYGNTEMQNIDGQLTVKDVENVNNIYIRARHTDLINIEDSTDYIILDVYGKFSDATEKQQFDPWTGSFGGTYACIYADGEVRPMQLFAQVTDWSGATPGATYMAGITFTFETD